MKRILNVLVACESSGTVRDAFRKLGHNAWSCDLLGSDSDPDHHATCDIFQLLSGHAVNIGHWHPEHKAKIFREKWDLMIAHPPCTYLCNSGVRWLYGTGKKFVRLQNCGSPLDGAMGMCRATTRWVAMEGAARFFAALYMRTNIPHRAVENPIMHGHGALAIGKIVSGARGVETRPDQIVQPWMFGHPETKATGLYLANLPKLVATNVVNPVRGSVMHKLPPSKDRWKLRSKTYQGIADAMAEQWSEFILES